MITTITCLLLWLVIPHNFDIAFLGLSRSIWVDFHTCSGIVGLIVIFVHIAWHWEWLKALRGRPLRRMSEKLRSNRVVDRIMWITFIGTNIFGVITWMIHFWSDIYVVSVPNRLHVVFGFAWTILAAVHLVLHWKWIASTARRYVQANLSFLASKQ